MDRIDDADVWARFPRDPRRSEHGTLRATDGEREVVRDVLATAYADGRLDRDELDQRQERLGTSRTLGDLPALLADLVADRPDRAPVSRRTGSLVGAADADLVERAEARWRDQRRTAVQLLLGSILLTLGFGVLLLGAVVSLPMLVLGGLTGANLLRVQLSHHDRVTREVERLERRRAQQLRQRELGEA